MNTFQHKFNHEILANKTFTVTDGLMSWFFVITFVHLTYVQIALIWGFPVQLDLWKSVYWLWKYKLDKVYNKFVDEFFFFLTILDKACFLFWIVSFSMIMQTNKEVWLDELQRSSVIVWLYQITNMLRRRNYLWEKMWKMSEEYGNILWCINSRMILASVDKLCFCLSC